MRASAVVGLSFVALTLGGCATNQIVGTWTGRGGANASDFSFGSVSFVGDQTFTAEARYGGTTRVQSGTWSATKDHLSLSSGNTEREYTYALNDGALVVTDPKSGRSVTLDRMAK